MGISLGVRSRAEDTVLLQRVRDKLISYLERGVQEVPAIELLELSGVKVLRPTDRPQETHPDADPLTGCMPVTAKDPA